MNGKELLVDLLLERLTGFEDRGVARGKLHGLTGGRIASLTGIAMLHGESTKTEESDGLASGDSVNDSTKNAVNNSGGLLLAECILSGDFFHKFSFIHD